MSGERTALLPRVAAGDAAAVDLVLERYGSLVWSLATRGLRDRPSAEDAVQEIFLDVWRSAGRFDPARGAEAVFVATIARRRIADAQRKRSRGPVIVDEAAASSLEFPTEHDAFAQLINLATSTDAHQLEIDRLTANVKRYEHLASSIRAHIERQAEDFAQERAALHAQLAAAKRRRSSTSQ